MSNTIEKYGVTHTSKLDSVKNKTKITNIDRYGFISPSMNNKIKEKIKKSNKNKYGVDYPLQNGEVVNNLKSYFIEKYGFDNPMKVSEVKEKVRKTNLDRYGCISYSYTDEFKTNLSNKFYEKSLSKLPTHIERIDIIDSDFRIKCSICETESTISRSLFYLRLNRYKTEVCPICNPLYDTYVSSHELNLSEFLKSHNINHINSYRDKYEIDIFIPEYKIGLEINGIYWHSELFKDKNYHLNKKKYFQERGIEVIQIWEDDWLHKNDIVKSVILSKLGLVNKIYARKCEIREVNNKDSSIFLNDNHLQGYVSSSKRYGLYYKNDIVSLMTFSKRKYMKNDDFELVRFCNKIGFSVIGGSSKLLNHFIKNNEFNNIISYAKCDYTSLDSNMYIKIGFKFLSHTGVGYYWCKGTNRFNRYNFRKDKLIKDGYSPDKTESEIMYERKYTKCWDSGNYKFILLKTLPI